MTPAARVAAAIDVLDEILRGDPAEKALTGWARRSRFAGSKDRAAVRDHVFQVLRCRRSYAALGGGHTGRGLMIGALRAAGDDPDLIFTGTHFAPAALTPQERSAGRPPADGAESLDLPDWLWTRFLNSLGNAAATAAAALRERAPVMLRVNLRTATRRDVIECLAAEDVVAEPAGIANSALIVREGARRVAATAAYREGFVELQDGSSQAAMEALEIPDGSRVLDYCAGGGGKVLALAAQAHATWVSHDLSPRRMKDLPQRAARAGVDVKIAGPPDLQPGSFDLVLCDAPCSGSGTWRRTPDAKWRLTPDDLVLLTKTQARILDQAAPLVAVGGTLAYATCSVLTEENEDIARAFVARNTGWKMGRARRWPVSSEGDGFFLETFKRI